MAIGDTGGKEAWCIFARWDAFAGGASKKELRIMAKLLFCQVVLGSKPQVPALSRWMKCRATAKWFYFAFSVRGIYLHGSTSLYKLKGTKKKSLQTECAELQANLNELVQASSSGPVSHQTDSSAAGVFMLPDLPVCKIMSVRARKSADWVCHPSSPLNLAISLQATEPATDFAHWLFAQQREPLLQVVGGDGRVNVHEYLAK